jgi:pyridoxamine 5'-phosphate oxidase family protein
VGDHGEPLSPEALSEEEWKIEPEDLAEVSPYLTEHIMRFGKYSTHELGITLEADGDEAAWMPPTEAELDYLATQHIGRLATVSPGGQVQNNPTNFFLDVGTGTIVIGGGALGRTKKFRNVQQGSTVAFVVDDLATVDPRAPRGIKIRGKAAALTDHEPPLPGLSQEVIRIIPIKIISWGLDGPRASRTV